MRLITHFTVRSIARLVCDRWRTPYENSRRDTSHKKYANQRESNITSHGDDSANTSETNKRELSKNRARYVCRRPSASDRAMFKPSHSKIYGQTRARFKSHNSPPLQTSKNLATNVFLTMERSRNQTRLMFIPSPKTLQTFCDILARWNTWK